MQRIKYICYHSYSEGNEYRQGVQSASTKVDYIVTILNRIGISVDIISKTGLSFNEFRPSFGGRRPLGNGNSIRHFFSLGCRDIIAIYLISRAINTLHFFFWMLFHIRKNEQIIVYHSNGYSFTFLLIKILIRPIIIGEIEEIYKDVRNSGRFINYFERKFILCCDKYIFPTALLNERLNKTGKKHLIIHGVYAVEKTKEEKFKDGKIHVVYGGTLDPAKGCVDAAKTIKLLDNKYYIHICGGGSNEHTELINSLIESLHKEGCNNVSYDGNLSSEDYKKFIQKCHIGLCTQDPKAAFTSTSFPSKILMYLSNGLKVVSIKIPSVYDSVVSSAIYFYDEQNSESIAEAIKSVNLEKENGGDEILTALDTLLQRELRELLL